MNQGISLHIGVGRLSTQRYRSAGALCSPENDARAMAQIAEKEGYGSIEVLLTEKASKRNFMQYLSDYAQALNSGDTLLLTFSGHGGQQKDENMDEEDGKDETWCFFDDYLSDDELGLAWKAFKPGVRIIVVSSSCHSRTGLKPFPARSLRGNMASPANWRDRPLIKPALHFYPEDTEIKASILHISACDDQQEARDGDPYSKFTGLLLKCWDDGRFEGNYQDLVARINRDAGYLQKSAVAVLGNNCPLLVNSRPFTLLTSKT